jgi:hypothetical protein
MGDTREVQARNAPREEARSTPIKRPAVPEFDRFRMRGDFNLYGTSAKGKGRSKTSTEAFYRPRSST